MYEKDIRSPTIKKNLSKIVNTIFYKKYLYLGENIFIHCRWITEVQLHVNIFFFKFIQRAAKLQTDSNQEVTQK